MRNFNFKSESFQILDIKNLIETLIHKNYTIKRIQNLLGISTQQINEFLKYEFEPKQNDFYDNDLLFEEEQRDTSAYIYENLSPIEKIIYNGIR
jgi:hypothetical protein